MSVVKTLSACPVFAGVTVLFLLYLIIVLPANLNSFYWYQVTVPTDVTVHFVCWHVYGLLAFYVLMYLLMPHTNTVLSNNNLHYMLIVLY